MSQKMPIFFHFEIMARRMYWTSDSRVHRPVVQNPHATVYSCAPVWRIKISVEGGHWGKLVCLQTGPAVLSIAAIRETIFHVL